MFAVVRTGGKQYRVAPGDKIVVEKLDGNAGDKITSGDVLLAGDGSDLKSTDGLTVAAEIVAQAKADKVTVFKKRRRHNYRRKKGHRQQHTILKIVAIGDHKEEKKAAPRPRRAEGRGRSEGAGARRPLPHVRTKRPTRRPPSTKPAKSPALRPRTRPPPTRRRRARRQSRRRRRPRRPRRRPKPGRQKMLHLLRAQPRRLRRPSNQDDSHGT